MAVSPPRGYLGISAVAVLQDQDALRLSVHPICSQVEPPVLMELDLLRTFCLSEAVLMASGSWHRGSELFLGCIYHVRILETHQLCFECNLWMMDMVAGLVGGYLSRFPAVCDRREGRRRSKLHDHLPATG